MPNKTSTFFPGNQETPAVPLDRYLPPYQPGMLPNMVQQKGNKSGWILDPLGSQPLAALDLAKSGFRVFVSSNNPILTSFYELLALAPSKSDWNAALNTLGTLKIHNERLENYLQKPFFADCPKCGKTTNRVIFLWKKEAALPHSKKIDCSQCGSVFHETINQVDIQNLSLIGNTTLHKSRAIQRIFSDEEPPVQTLQFLKEAYHARSLASVVTLINRLDGLQTSQTVKKIIELYLIIAFDFATTLWPNNQFKTRPRQIVIPNEFEEFNLWLKIEEAASEFSSFDQSVPLTWYPEFPPESGGICLYPHRYRESEITQLPNFEAVATVLPRPNQAFWSLCAIWSGWLWGNQSAQQIKSALTRQRYDWFWLTNALKKIFNQSSQNIPWFAVAPELTSGYSVSYLAAAAANGFRLTDYAYSPFEKTAQLYWDRTYTPIAIGSLPTQDKMLVEYLKTKGDSGSYQELLDYYILRASREGLILKSGLIPDDNLYMNIQKRFETNLKNTNQIKKIDQDTMEFGEYWLSSPPQDIVPLLDKIEGVFLEFINANLLFSLTDVKRFIDQMLPAYLPTPSDWLMTLLESYCEIDSATRRWKIIQQEKNDHSQEEISEIENIILKMGQDFAFTVQKEHEMIQWKNQNKITNYRFFITQSSILTKFSPPLKTQDGEKTIIVYRGSRANLFVYKNKHNIIYQALIQNSDFVKFRQIKQLVGNPTLSFEDWQNKMNAEPTEWKIVNQLSMF